MDMINDVEARLRAWKEKNYWVLDELSPEAREKTIEDMRNKIKADILQDLEFEQKAQEMRNVAKNEQNLHNSLEREDETNQAIQEDEESQRMLTSYARHYAATSYYQDMTVSPELVMSNMMYKSDNDKRVAKSIDESNREIRRKLLEKITSAVKANNGHVKLSQEEIATLKNGAASKDELASIERILDSKTGEMDPIAFLKQAPETVKKYCEVGKEITDTILDAAERKGQHFDELTDYRVSSMQKRGLDRAIEIRGKLGRENIRRATKDVGIKSVENEGKILESAIERDSQFKEME